MPSKSLRNLKSKSAEVPSVMTNFRQIKGINQLVEARLHRAGIKTIEDLTNLQPDEIFAAIGNLKGVTVKQIVEQDWIGQAHKLVGKKGVTNGAIESEGFIVNLFLSKKKQVHSTQILHVNSDEGEKWDGWDSQRLLNFISNRSGLALPKIETVESNAIAIEPVKESSTMIEEKPKPTSQVSVPLVKMDVAGIIPPPVPKSEIGFRNFEIIPSHSSTPSKLLRKGESFDIRLSLDIDNEIKQFDSSIDYTAAIFAKGLSASTRVNLGEASGVISSAKEAIEINIPNQDLALGTYRLEAALSISSESKAIGNPVQARTIFQVF